MKSVSTGCKSKLFLTSSRLAESSGDKASTADNEQWTMVTVQRTVGIGLWAVDSGQWTVGSGQWAVDSEKWAVKRGSGQWVVDNGHRAVGSGQWA
jgi:hypothetical protein